MKQTKIYFCFLSILAIFAVACSYRSVKPSISYDKEAGDEIYFGRITVTLFNEEATASSKFIFQKADKETVVLQGSQDGVLLVTHRSGQKPRLKKVIIEKRDISIEVPVDIPLGNRYYKDDNKGVRCFGQLNIRAIPFQEGENQEVDAVTELSEKAVLPPGVSYSGDLVCAAVLKTLLSGAPQEVTALLKERLPEHWVEVDPLYPERTPDKILALPENIYSERFMRPYSFVVLEMSDKTTTQGSALSSDEKALALLEAETSKLLYIPLTQIAKITIGAGEAEGLNEKSPRELEESEIAAFVTSKKCGENKNYKPGITSKPRPSLRHTVAVCEDNSAVGDFYFKIKTAKGKLWNKCSSSFDCGGDECAGGHCARRCENNEDCGNDDKATLCADGMCLLRCETDAECPDDALKCEDDANGKMCLPSLTRPEKLKPMVPFKMKKK